MKTIKKLNFKKLIILLLCFLLLTYIFIYIYNAKIVNVKTEMITYAQSPDSYKTTGYIVRDEVLINNDSEGVITYLFNDGDSVSNGENIAQIYKNEEDANAEVQIKDLEKKISNLEQLNLLSKESEKDPTKIDSQIYSTLGKIINQSSSNSFFGMDNQIEDLSYLINERQVLLKGDIDYSDTIKKYQNQIEALKASRDDSLGTIKNTKDGTFTSEIDGYENVFDYNNIKNIMPDQISNEILPKEKTSNTIGKIISEFNWYIVAKVPSDQVVKYKVGDTMSISIPLATNISIPGTIVAVNQKTLNDEAAIVFMCNYMNDDLSKTRIEDISIENSMHSGLMVPKKAVHINELSRDIRDENGNITTQTDQVQGVYILRGNRLFFKQIVPKYSFGNYIICEENPNVNTLYTDTSIHLYDKVVTGGKNLYDGKSI